MEAPFTAGMNVTKWSVQCLTGDVHGCESGVVSAVKGAMFSPSDQAFGIYKGFASGNAVQAGQATVATALLAGSFVAPEADGAAATGGSTTDIFRVSNAKVGTSELDHGFDPSNFPRTDDGEADGAAHFGNKARVDDWANNGGAGISGQGLQITVETAWLEMHADIYPGMTDDQIEYAIPSEKFGELNQFPRKPWTPGT